ncbi:MAG: aldo/keto reductase [Candidatus Aminicenantes bacterium]|jgi:diketogulonate reductase-like aldo/keto reductase
MLEDLRIDTKIELNDGVKMPIFGLGTYRAQKGGEAREAVRYALEVGYRLIDTASMYGNEDDVGQAILQSGLKREEIFVTTKLWNADHGYDRAIGACKESLRRLKLDYVDLYLIHWPVEGLRKESWKALQKLKEEGKCRSIGISNFMTWHLEELLADSPAVPSVNQVEFHAYLYLKELFNFCKARGIQLESYSPLTKGRKLRDPRLQDIAEKYGKTPAQLLIRWVLQKGIIVIPKSSKKERIRENAQVFDFQISDTDMAVLDSFDLGLRTSWDPTAVE